MTPTLPETETPEETIPDEKVTEAPEQPSEEETPAAEDKEKETTAEERQNSFKEMMILALDTIIA